ncbi:GNAT family N-acetyltransferase [Streptomyces atratus]|uniref:GNAT family N-acetyltransferase n=1 Tax=Streptomyces atratus TaxID=1893 RepID=UPI00210E4A05|nr:N-acetyltransferase [Streptomyces atratus]
MSDVVELRPVTAQNLDACLALRVHPDQEGFVAPNVRSLAEAYVHPEAQTRVIHHGSELVGFVLFHPVEVGRPDQGHCIVRFMVDHRFQGQGIGRRALRAALDWVSREHHTDVVQLSFRPENVRARSFYRAAGFEDTGEVSEGEIVMRWTVP